MTNTLLPTTVIGSYPQPEWLVNHETLAKHGVPRVRAKDIWRIPEPLLQQAQDDATLLAIRAMERAGIDIITDGEIRRESYSNRFATALEGLDLDKTEKIEPRPGRFVDVARVVGKIRRSHALELDDMRFLRMHTDHKAKITLPGPFTMAQQVVNHYYKDDEEMVMDFAAAVNEEALELEKAGADVIQLDEPWVRQNPEGARRYAVKAINRALRGLKCQTAVHVCFGYGFVMPGDKPGAYPFLPELADSAADQISIEAAQPRLDLGVLKDLSSKVVMLGCLNLAPNAPVETPQTVADRIRAGLKHLPPTKLMPAPDCGMKYLPLATAFGKLKALADGAAIVRKEIS
jgi:5-methyltetrahydropteroyltriglutamate--homocysteine methyltransferase